LLLNDSITTTTDVMVATNITTFEIIIGFLLVQSQG